MAYQREAKHQRLDRLQAQDDQRVADRPDMLAAAVEAGIDRAKDLAREGRVFGNQASDFDQIDIVFLRQVKHLHGNRRQRRQVRALGDSTDQLLVHRGPHLGHPNQVIDLAIQPSNGSRSSAK